MKKMMFHLAKAKDDAYSNRVVPWKLRQRSLPGLADMPTFTPAAMRILEALGIPVAMVLARNLVEFVEATSLEVAETGQEGRKHMLAPAAAQAWQRLKDAASRDGVELNIISAFRSVQRQVEIIERKISQGLSIDQILEFSAPPFFSEHHTGCAIDVGTPGSKDLEREFEETDAFVWLTQHAGDYGFEMSFPLNNASGYAYEPWHWRYSAT